MKAIIIQDTDARALVAQLELHALQANNVIGPLEGKTATEVNTAIHGGFRYVVVRWLQEQGASVTR